jgi:hypothetical protein
MWKTEEYGCQPWRLTEDGDIKKSLRDFIIIGWN